MKNYPTKIRFRLSILILAILIPCLPHLWSDSLDDATLAEIRDGFEERQAEALRQQMFTPYPDYSEPSADSIYAWNRLNFALAVFYTYKDDPEAPQNFMDAANQAIIDASEQYLEAGVSATTRRDGGLHWSGNHWVRLHETFGSDSRFYPGLLSEEAESSIRELLWTWVSNEATLEEADASLHNTWRIRESENHSAMMDQISWGGAKILRRFEPYKNMEYKDGSTAQEQYEAWTDFLIQYLRERGKRGLFVEYHSNTYTKYTTQNFYNYLDLSENPTLRKLARSVLDLVWADAALETMDGVVGGAAARMARPNDLNPSRNGYAGLMWYYYGEGQEMNLHPGNMMLMLSDYRIPDVIMDIALDVQGRGAYEYISRKPGLSEEDKANSYAQESAYYVDYDNHQILRYSYVTPDFVLGTHMFPNLSNARWSNISSQNRFHSALLRTESDFVQIVPQGRATTSNHRGLNEQWSVQKYGTLITQKLRTSERIAEMRVYIPSEDSVTVEEVGDWIFINSEYTYSGVRVATGGYQWQDANWIELNDEYSPVIIEVARSTDYQDYDAFKTAALSTSLEVVTESGNRQLEYTGLGDSGDFVFYIDTDELPMINNDPYNLTSEFTYKSPYLNAQWPASKVTIEKDDRSLTLDFDLETPGTSGWIDTGDWLGWIYDQNAPWVWSASLSKWIHISDGAPNESGGWVYIPKAF